VAPLRIAVLVKQIPAFEAMELGPDGRLVREGLELELNAYCRRAVSQGSALAAATGGRLTVLTLGPPSAEDSVREALAWALDAGVVADGVVITDPAFAGSDTLATARALAAALQRLGPFDLVLTGRNSVDADTGQVPPELATLLDLPFATGVRELELSDDASSAQLWLEHDDEWVSATVGFPAVLSCAERLIDPAKRTPDQRAAVPAELITTMSAVDLGPGPWGEAGSPTTVGEVRVLDVERLGLMLDGPVEDQVARLVEVLVDRGLLDRRRDRDDVEPVPPTAGGDACIAVVVEPDRERLTRELLGAAARLSARIGARVVAIGADLPSAERLSSWGADEAVAVAGTLVEEDVAVAVGRWSMGARPWAVLAPGTAWGREVASRAAALLGAGLTGDAVGLNVENGRLAALKPAFGGRLVAVITADSPVQMATVRAGMLPLPAPRAPADLPVATVAVEPRGRVVVHERTRDDDTDLMANADVVVGIGHGVPPERYDELRPLLDLLGAELGATRKVTDNGWLPRARQIGITGHSISPRLYLALAIGGKFNHTVGVRAAGTIVAINPDPGAPIFQWADVGLVASWEEALPVLVEHLEEARVGSH
jgi:electron transfer flavoprotein alpha subunit